MISMFIHNMGITYQKPWCKIVNCVLLFIIFSPLAYTQPLPCGANPAMTSTCEQACIICDIDGFTGINNSNVRGVAPQDFCTSVVHNMQWISFIAGTTNLKIELHVFNCSIGQGLEVGVYEGLGCTNYRRMSECDTDIRPNQRRVFVNTEPLVIGQYYFLVMDGSSGDICNYTFKVLEGSTKVAPLTKAAVIEVPSVICTDVETEIKTPGLVGATIYDWSVNGVLKHTGLTYKSTFTTPGEYTVCLDAKNVCDKAPQACRKITVLPTKYTTIDREVCFGECIRYAGNDYCKDGAYKIKYAAKSGCDSIVTLNVKVKNEIVVDRALMICEGDTLTLGNGKFTTAGSHIAFITGSDGCKIKVNLELTLIKCKMRGKAVSTPVSCFDKVDGSIAFHITNGTPPFTYKWKQLENEAVTGSGSLSKDFQNEVLAKLDEGAYIIEVFDGFGNQTILTVNVSQPTRLTSKISHTDYHGYGIPCVNDSKGKITVIASGGNGSYTYTWSTATLQGSEVDNLSEGTYTVTVEDSKGCKIITSDTIKAPAPLLFTVEDKDPNCTGLSTGSLKIINVKGGVGPYQYSFANAPFGSKQEALNLVEGIYTTQVKDLNGCISTQVDTMYSAIIPVLDFKHKYDVDLGDSTMVAISSDPLDVSYAWTPSKYLSCDDCASPESKPLFNTIYKVDVTSKDGCVTSAKIELYVNKERKFIASNVFTPNNDGTNEQIKIYTDKAASSVEQFEIYDRWGNLYYRGQNLPRGLVEVPWISTTDLQNVVYTYKAKVRFIDDFIKYYYGSILLMR
jgi:hypothetical protein